jgi:hypothetical protein
MYLNKEKYFTEYCRKKENSAGFVVVKIIKKRRINKIFMYQSKIDLELFDFSCVYEHMLKISLSSFFNDISIFSYTTT